MGKNTDTKEKLLETATQLIWQSNYSNVGVNEICQQAGVTKGSFYHYFETKADLFYEASEHHWLGMKKDLDALFSPAFSSLEHLENLIQFVVFKQKGDSQGDGNPVSGCPFFTAGGQAGANEKRVREASQAMSEHAVKYCVVLARNLKAENVLNSQADPQQVGRLVHQFIQGLLMYGRVYSDLEVVKTDLREGLYRLLDLQHEYRQSWADSEPFVQDDVLSLTVGGNT